MASIMRIGEVVSRCWTGRRQGHKTSVALSKDPRIVTLALYKGSEKRVYRCKASGGSSSIKPPTTKSGTCECWRKHDNRTSMWRCDLPSGPTSYFFEGFQMHARGEASTHDLHELPRMLGRAIGSNGQDSRHDKFALGGRRVLYVPLHSPHRVPLLLTRYRFGDTCAAKRAAIRSGASIGGLRSSHSEKMKRAEDRKTEGAEGL
ncbi:hypothetical protein BC628DRAFT_734411 [Trametes gibbosa]|nr:hypothetical protein BC628DRAFT_734411 [Trametes gibbosa]